MHIITMSDALFVGSPALIIPVSHLHPPSNVLPQMSNFSKLPKQIKQVKQVKRFI